MQPVSNTVYAVMTLVFFLALALLLSVFGSGAVRSGVAVALLFAGLSQFLAQSYDDKLVELAGWASVVSGAVLTIATIAFGVGQVL